MYNVVQVSKDSEISSNAAAGNIGNASFKNKLLWVGININYSQVTSDRKVAKNKT